MSFFVAGSLLFIAFVLTLIFVREKFTPPPPTAFSFFTDTKLLLLNGGIAGIIGMIGLHGLARNIQYPVMPLIVETMVVTRTTLATQSGMVNSAAGMASVLAGLAVGYLADKMPLFKLGMTCALTGAVFGVSLTTADQVWQLALLNFLFSFFIGGMEPILNVSLTRVAPPDKRGSAIGLFGCARALGWFLGSLSGGFFAAILGLRSVFVVSAGVFTLIAGLLFRLRFGKTD
jgi:MFS family permease